MNKSYKIKILGTEYEVDIHSVEDNIARLTVNEVEFEVEVEGFTTNPTRMSTKPIVKTDTMQSETPVVKRPVASNSGYVLKSPLPGIIIDIPVKEGDSVKAGQVMVILEAMKMENNIEIDRDGIIAQIGPKKGDAVQEGDLLIKLK